MYIIGEKLGSYRSILVFPVYRLLGAFFNDPEYEFLVYDLQNSPLITVLIENSPFPFPFRGISLSLGLSICSSSARADSRDLCAETGRFARSCFVPGGIITVNLLKRVSKVCHNLRKRLAFPLLVILSCLIHLFRVSSLMGSGSI